MKDAKQEDVLKFGSVSSDTHQVMSYTQEIHASGKLDLIVMINTPLPKILLGKAQIVVTCDKFKKFANVRAEHHHSSFPYDIRTDFNQETGTLTIDIPPITTQHCALLKAVWKLTYCDKGDCCHDDGNFHNEHKMCRYSHNPCKEHTYCTGKHHECPPPENKDDDEPCDWRGYGQHYVATAASHLKHTRMPASGAVSIASTSAAIPSYAEMAECTGHCEKGMCHLKVEKQACCKEVLRYGDSYGYGAAPSYGYEGKGGYGRSGDDYDDYGKRDYKGGDDYGYKGDDDYGRYDRSYRAKDDGPYEGRYGDAGKYDAYAQAAAVDAGAEKDPASETVKSPIGTGYMHCWHG